MPKKERFDNWDLDYKPEKGDGTGPNLLVKTLPNLSFYDKTRDAKMSRKKVPTDLCRFRTSLLEYHTSDALGELLYRIWIVATQAQFSWFINLRGGL